MRFFVWGRVTVLGSKVGTVLVARTQGPDLESDHTATVGVVAGDAAKG